MKINPSKAVSMAVLLIWGCSQTEVYKGKQRFPESEDSATPQEQTTNTPPVTPGASDAVKGTDSGANPNGESNLSKAPEPAPEDTKGKDGGQEENSELPPNQSSNPPASTPSTPPSPPEPPLPPSKLGWNGAQLIGTSQLYFLPID